jgi:ABC-type phosphate transport system permease subunit
MVVWMAAGMARRFRRRGGTCRGGSADDRHRQGWGERRERHYHALFAIGCLLLVFTFGMNLISEHFMARIHRKGGRR